MATIVELPQMTDTMTEAVLVSWLKNEGDAVRAGDPIAEIETDKAIQELEAPVAGTILKLVGEPGITVAVASPVAVIGMTGEALPDLAARAEGTTPATSPAPAKPISAETAPSPASPTGRVKSSPVARRIAGEAELDIRQVAGTGPGGRIVRRDVEGALSARATTAPSVDAEAETIPIGRLRRKMVDRLVETHRSVPVFTATRRISMDAAVAFREGLKKTTTFAGGIGWSELVIRAAAIAMTRVPELNARWSDDGIRHLRDVNIGVAVGLDEGVVVPVIRRCQVKALREIAAEFRAVTERAARKTLLATDVGDSTFTVSNLGMYGVDEFTAVLNAPDAAILAVGAVASQPVVREGAIVTGRVMAVTLTVDHRTADGIHAARWLAAFAEALENPVVLAVD